MSLDPDAVKIANERLWNAHPELARRLLTDDPKDAALSLEWRRYYHDALSAAAPPPAVVPAPAPAPVAAIAPCPLAPVPVTTSDCSKMKDSVQPGDIVLRGEAGDPESDFLAKVSGCPYSHAGIVTRNAAGDLVVVDAYPGRSSGAVAEISVDEFFCGHHATDGIVTRPKDCDAAQKAAKWAMDQTADPSYKFDLWDPWNTDPKRLYCADFVYQCFQNAGIDLAPTKTDLLDAAHRQTTLSEARKMAAQDNRLAKLASDSKIESELKKRSGGNSEYITPCQIGMNPGTDTVATLKTAASVGGGGKKT
jgi:hypothetical protein